MAEAYVWPELTCRRGSARVAPEEVREQARLDGRAAGFEEGLAEGRRQAQAEIAAVHEQMKGSLEHLETVLADAADARLTELAAVAHALCRQVLGTELRTNPEVFEHVLNEAMTRLEVGAEGADVHLNPDDYGPVQQHYHGALRMHPDPQVAPGAISVRLVCRAVAADPGAIMDELFEEVRRDLAG